MAGGWLGGAAKVGGGGGSQEGVSSWPVNVIAVHLHETSPIFQFSEP